MKKDPHQDGLGFFPAMILQAEAELVLAQGDYERARVIGEEALSAFRRLGMRPFLSPALYLLGRAWVGLDQPGAGRNCWLAARAEAEAIGSRRLLWQILAALSRLEPDPLEAERLRGQAGEVITFIAGHTPVELRATFLTLPAVRAILAKESIEKRT
jgi:hypothetical protein